MAKKKNTSEDLASVIKQGFAESKNAIEELALITKRGFDAVDERFNKVDERFDKLEKINTREHEEINLGLNNVAYRFELLALQKRVEVLEKKAGVARKSF